MKTANGNPLPAMSTDVQLKSHDVVPPGLVLGKYLELAPSVCCLCPWGPHTHPLNSKSKKHLCVFFFSAAEHSIQALLLLSVSLLCLCVPAATPRAGHGPSLVREGISKLFIQEMLICHIPPPVANDLLGHLCCIHLVCRNMHTDDQERMW